MTPVQDIYTDIHLHGNRIIGAEVTSTTFIFTQDMPLSTWTVYHNLGKFPSVTVVDSAGSSVIATTRYINNNTIELNFGSAFSGKAYLN